MIANLKIEENSISEYFRGNRLALYEMMKNVFKRGDENNTQQMVTDLNLKLQTRPLMPKSAKFKNNSLKINSVPVEGGINPEISLLSGILGETHEFKDNFLKDYKLSDFVTLKKFNNNMGYYQDFYVKIKNKNTLFSRKKEIEATIGTRPFQRSAKINGIASQNLSESIGYQKFNNFSYIIPYSIDLMENKAYEGLLNENINRFY